MIRLYFIFCLTIISHVARSQSSGALVLPGDFPDPSVVKIGDAYWATATTSNWAPVFPILQSTDLFHWESKGQVFTKLPDWADYYFWAPEISYDNGRIYVYYSAHKKNGNLCLAVASADKPEGPYTDHGPLMCQAAGSIDGFPMRDETGKLYLIWKEDGNSVKQPTPIWAIQMKEDRTGFIGEPVELFRNDADWEGNLVEGVSMIREGEYYYAFYAGAGCCGRECTYAVGIARSKKLLGPWEKYDKNPVLDESGDWKCPGHGTPVKHNGKNFFLYHAYNKTSDVYAGRQGLLQEFRFTSDGWIAFVNTAQPKSPLPKEIVDDFTDADLGSEWQWSVFDSAQPVVRNGKLDLAANNTTGGAFVGFKSLTDSYQAEVKILLKGSSATAGLGLIGDDKNMVRVLIKKDKLVLSKVDNGKDIVLGENVFKPSETIFLRMAVQNGAQISFAYSGNGKNYQPLNDQPIDGKFLPPWDRAVRIGLISKGNSAQKAIFEKFVLRNE